MVARSSKKPKWVVEKERNKKQEANRTIWLFGLHAVRDALLNDARVKHRLLVTRNAADKLAEAISTCGIEPELQDPRKFRAPIDLTSVHQGAALEVSPLDWGTIKDKAAVADGERPVLVLLDRVSDPHNVGAILRSAEVFGARAVISPERHSAPETGALAKTASGALERQPYIMVRNLADTILELKDLGYLVLGFDGEAGNVLGEYLANVPPGPLALVLGAEGPGLRDRTREVCDELVRIEFAGNFGSLNVSNAAAVALYATSQIG